MSQIGWIDFSSKDRNLVHQALAMLTEPGTLDELGIGQIRDAFSDVLFPGISTIQTRAKYFMTVPRIFRDYQSLPLSKRKIYSGLGEYLRIQENNVARILDEAHDENESGIIGRTRLNSGGVDRRPSVIYWNGLRTLGIVKTQLSLRDFCRQIERDGDRDAFSQSVGSEGSDDLDCMNDRPLVCLPDYSEAWKEDGNLRLRLTRKEAEFLKGRFVETPSISSSVPAQLFKHGLVENALKDFENTAVSPFDLLVDVLKTSDGVDLTCRSYLKVAQEFSLAMEGPHLRYNILLNKEFPVRVKEYQDDYSQWLDEVRRLNLFAVNNGERWLDFACRDKRRRIKERSQQFVKKCCEYFQGNNPVDQLDDLVFKQAVANKGQRSWLKRGLNQEKWLGIRRLDYRWGTARTIIQDILEGLHAGA